MAKDFFKFLAVPTAAIALIAGGPLVASAVDGSQDVGSETSLEQAISAFETIKANDHVSGPQVTYHAADDSCAFQPLPGGDREKLLKSLNAMRKIAKVDPLALLPESDADWANTQQAAASMAATHEIAHDLISKETDPDTGVARRFKCRTNAAGDVSRASVLSGILNAASPDHIRNVVNNPATDSSGYRLLSLDPRLAKTAFGVASHTASGDGASGAASTISTMVMRAANGLGEQDKLLNEKATKPAILAWPAAGYFPYGLLPKDVWTFSAPVDLKGAQVEVTMPDGQVKTPKLVGKPWDISGYNTIAFQPDRYTNLSVPAKNQFHTYQVKVKQGKKSWSYPVRVFTKVENQAPSFSKDLPAEIVIAEGGTAETEVAMQGYPSFTYQAQKQSASASQWENVGSAGQAATAHQVKINLPAANFQNGDKLRIVAIQNGKQYPSSVSTIKIRPRPTVSVQPTSQTVVAGEAAKAWVATSNMPDSAIQWFEVSGTSETAVGQGKSYTPAKTSPGTYTYRVKASADGFDPAVAEVTFTVIPKLQNGSVKLQDIKVIAGSSPTLSVEGQLQAGAMTVKGWQKKAAGETSWSDIPGETGPTLTLSNVALADDGSQYQAIIQKGTQTATSTTAQLSVVKKLKVTQQPTAPAAGVLAGKSLSLQAQANYPQAKVQWQIKPSGADWQDIAGATQASYSRTVAAADKNAQFRAVFTVADPDQTATSQPTTLQVPPALQLTAQPQNVVTVQGKPVKFSVAANLDDATYQWQSSVDGQQPFKDINGATNASYQVPDPAKDSKVKYRVLVKQGSGDLAQEQISDTVAYSLVEQLAPSQQSAKQEVIEDSQVTLQGTFNLTSKLHYQWQYSPDGQNQWSDIAGANANSYQFNAGQTQAGFYRLQAKADSPAQTAHTQAIEVAVHAKLQISQDLPDLVELVEGEAQQLTFKSNGTQQWQMKAAKDDAQWENIAGVNDPTSYTVNGKLADSGTSYRVLVSGPLNQTVTSKETILKVYPKLSEAKVTGETTVAEGKALAFQAQVKPQMAGVTYLWQFSDDGQNWTAAVSEQAGKQAKFEAVASRKMDGKYLRVLVTAPGKQSLASQPMQLHVLFAPQEVVPKSLGATGTGSETDPYLIPVKEGTGVVLDIQAVANPEATTTWETLGPDGEWTAYQIPLNRGAANHLVSAPKIALSANQVVDGAAYRLKMVNKIGSKFAYFKLKVVKEIPAGSAQPAFTEAGANGAGQEGSGGSAASLSQTGSVGIALGVIAMLFLAAGVGIKLLRRRQ